MGMGMIMQMGEISCQMCSTIRMNQTMQKMTRRKGVAMLVASMKEVIETVVEVTLVIQ